LTGTISETTWEIDRFPMRSRNPGDALRGLGDHPREGPVAGAPVAHRRIGHRLIGERHIGERHIGE
jgi:hypothetical protein